MAKRKDKGVLYAIDGCSTKLLGWRACIPGYGADFVRDHALFGGVREVAAPLKDKLGMMFETADFVKLQGLMPLPDENARNLDIAFEFVNHTNEQVQELKEREKQEKESREREEREKEEAARKEAEEGEEK